jgi:hypothetical protein
MKTAKDLRGWGGRAGGVLIVTLLLASILGITLGSYLYWVRTQNVLVAESQYWNSALALAEAGIEEGLAQLNVMSGTDYAANYQPSAQTNFSALGANSPGAYGPKLNTLTNGSYSVIIIPPTNPAITLGPTIIATGYTMVPMVSRPIARVVQVTTTIKPLLNSTLVAISNVTMTGTKLTVDSYDSSDPNHSTNGLYNAATRMAGGDVGSLFGVISFQNASIYGHLETGPNGSYSLNNGTAGDLSWAGPGVEPGWWLEDFNMDVPDIQPPYTSGLPLPSAVTSKGTNTITLGSAPYYVQGDVVLGNNDMLYINGNATLYVTGSFTMKNNNATFLQVAAGGMLKLYVGSTSGAATSISLTQVNNSGNASTLQVYGLPTTKSLSWNGNTTFVGTLYAPEANFSLGGGGSTIFDFSGAVTALTVGLNGHFNFHYDQNLKRLGPLSGFTVDSWREL